MSKSIRKISPFEERIAKKIMRWYSKYNVFVYRLSGGRTGGTFPGGAPVCLVTMKGRKTGKWRTTPLIHIPHGDNIILVASQGGLSKNPIWYNNLLAHPELEVTVGYERREISAHRASDEQKDKLWVAICSVHSDFGEYQERTERNIPVMICSPRV